MIIQNETLLKIEILIRGVEFTQNALKKAKNDNAKIQNLVYNMPENSSICRPQELFIKGNDGYSTVVSCITSHCEKSAVIIDVNYKNELFANIENKNINDIIIEFVKEPSYYSRTISNGEILKKYISACGYDELNILPWKGCAISKVCKFCGVNTFCDKNDNEVFNAHTLSKNIQIWESKKEEYFNNLNEAIEIAIEDECCQEHMHLIIISGNLSEDCLDIQSQIYAEIAENIKSKVTNKLSEGIVVVMTPPKDVNMLIKMKDSGIQIVVFNLEVGNEPWFSKYCPGKSELGIDFFENKLKQAVNIFGKGNVWTNFVLGLEPVDKLIEVCRELAKFGIVPGANVLHFDKGNQLDCSRPKKEDVIYFFTELSKIYRENNIKPYYCSKALRTSLSNEAFDGRIINE